MAFRKDLSRIDTKTSLIYKSLKHDIVSGRLKPGEKLVASKIADSYRISVIPIREAFGQLKAEGLLKIIPHTGIYVTEIDINYLDKIYPIRGILEGYATRLALPFLSKNDFNTLYEIIEKIDQVIQNKNYSQISHLNHNFHMTIYKASRNEYLVKMIDDLLDSTNRVRVMFDLIPKRAARSNLEHQKILESLKNEEIKKAERLVKSHIEKTFKVLIRFMEREKQKAFTGG